MTLPGYFFIETFLKKQINQAIFKNFPNLLPDQTMNRINKAFTTYKCKNKQQSCQTKILKILIF